MTREEWGERCRRLAGLQRPPPEPETESIAATDLRVGDCFYWGDVHLTVHHLARTDFIRATCAGQRDVIPIDLHPLEEVLVHTPRPALQWEATR
jgi:hypothetical protein